MCLILVKLSSILDSNISSVPFSPSSLLVFPLYICYIFCSFPVVLEYSFLNCFFPRLVSLCFSVLKITSCHILTFRDSLLGHVQSTDKPTTGFFCFVTVFFISSTSFWFLLRISISMLVSSIYSCCLFFGIKTLSILITVFNNPWSDYSNIPAISDSSSNACSVSSHCWFLL